LEKVGSDLIGASEPSCRSEIAFVSHESVTTARKGQMQDISGRKLLLMLYATAVIDPALQQGGRSTVPADRYNYFIDR